MNTNNEGLGFVGRPPQQSRQNKRINVALIRLFTPRRRREGTHPVLRVACADNSAVCGKDVDMTVDIARGPVL